MSTGVAAGSFQVSQTSKLPAVLALAATSTPFALAAVHELRETVESWEQPVEVPLQVTSEVTSSQPAVVGQAAVESITLIS